MTLIIAAANSEHAVLVADRRLSYDGRLVDDDQSKLGVMVTDDAWLAFGHTGLARAGTLDVHPWLLEALIECAKPDHLASGIVNRFRERASERLRRVRVPKPADKRLSVLFAGYRYSEEPARVSLALVSNFERENEVHSEPFDDFEATFMQDRRPPVPSHTEPAIILIGGRQDLVPITELQKLLGLLELRRPSAGLVGKTLAIIRDVADRDADNSVGKDCLSVTLTRDRPPSGPELELPGTYHPERATSKWFGPSFVDCRAAGLGIALMYPMLVEEGAPPGAGGLIPRVGRNEPCPCGSGKKYKRCHGA